jgi:transcriptional antiterminator RfaH
MMQDCTARWYVARTHPRAEAKAAAHLDRQGFSTYFPRYLKSRRHARRVETIAAPLFPRYLFVSVNMETQRWRSIQSTVGVMQLVRNGEEPAAISNRIIEDLKNREGELGFIKLDHRQMFRLGDKLRVVDGVFCDSLGLFEGMSDRDRVTILLDLLGRKVRVRLDADFVTAA